MIIKIIAIFIGSMIFPAIGYYIDYRRKEQMMQSKKDKAARQV